MIRTIFLKILKWSAFDFKISHHYTKCSFLLNSYKHKGYWYYGKNREADTIKNFYKLIKSGSSVLEIGGHIGYFTTLFAQLAGKNGKLVVFEPSRENLNYLIKNITFLPQDLSNTIQIIEKGAGDIDGKLDFFIDPITGQNNSFVKNFEGFYQNRKISGDKSAELEAKITEVVKLDSFFKEKSDLPDFVKIDVEGFEWNVISGFKSTIDLKRPTFMIEIQSDEENLFNYFIQQNYLVYNDSFKILKSFDNFRKFQTPNIFFLPAEYEL